MNNPQFEKAKTVVRHKNRDEKERELKVREQNGKLVKALEDIRATWGK